MESVEDSFGCFLPQNEKKINRKRHGFIFSLHVDQHTPLQKLINFILNSKFTFSKLNSVLNSLFGTLCEVKCTKELTPKN